MTEKHCRSEQGTRDSTIILKYPSGILSGSVHEIAGELIEATIVNRSSDTLFILSSYFDPSYQPASCLHRVDKLSGRYNFSFLPLLPYLGIRSGDTRIISAERVCQPYQVTYDFIKLPPGSFTQIVINVEAISAKMTNRDFLYQEFDVKKTSKFDKHLPLLAIERSTIPTNLESALNFAVYQNVELLCSPEAFYLDEFKFDEQAKSYSLLNLPMSSTLLRHLLGYE